MKVTCSYRYGKATSLVKQTFFVGKCDEWALSLGVGKITPARKRNGELVGWLMKLNMPIAVSQQHLLRLFSQVFTDEQLEELEEWLENSIEIHLYNNTVELAIKGRIWEHVLQKVLRGRVAKERIKRLGAGNEAVVSVTPNTVKSKTTGFETRNRGSLPFRDPRTLISLVKYANGLHTIIRVYSHVPLESASIEACADLNLREYQEDAIREFIKNGRLLVNLPPGAGKTRIGIGAIARINAKTVVLVPTRILKEQWERELRRFLRWEYGDIEIMTYQYAIRKSPHYFKKKLIVADEAHYLGARLWRVMARFGAPVLALSATPWRNDEGQIVLDMFPQYNSAESWKLWMERYKTITVPTVYYAPREYRVLRGIIAKHRKVLVLCKTIKSAKEISRRLSIPHVNAQMNGKNEIVEAFKNTARGALATTTMLSQGFDVPDIDAVVTWDAGGIITTLQFIGRVMRVGSRKYAYLLGVDSNTRDTIGRILGIYPRKLKM